MWQVIREYPRAVVYAVLMHVVLLILLVVSLDWTPKISQPGASKPIQAELVDQRKLDAVKQQKLAEQQRIKAEQARKKAEVEKQRKAEIAAKQKAEAAKKRKVEAAARKKAAAEKKRKADAAAKQKAAAEKQRKADAVAKQKAEAAAKQKAATEAKRKAAEAALQAQMAAEHEQRVSGVVAEYTAYIQAKVNRSWLRPPGVPEGLSCTVKVILIPGGDVANVEIIKSSGNPVFDRSVEAAVFKAAPMPLPPDSGLFNYFRDLRFIFTPE